MNRPPLEPGVLRVLQFATLLQVVSLLLRRAIGLSVGVTVPLAPWLALTLLVPLALLLFTWLPACQRRLGRAFLPLALLVGTLGVGWLMQRQRQQQHALAAANRRLAQLAALTEQLAASQERNRLARELHDTLAHTLSGVSVQLEAVQALWEHDAEAARTMLAQALSSTRGGLTEARRALQALRASPLAELGLARAVSQLAETQAARTGLDLVLRVPAQLEGLAPEVEQCVYRVAQEALSNVARHAAARVVQVELGCDPAHVRLTVADDGQGFEVAGVAGAHYGVQGLRERAALLGGTLAVDSAVGQGTTVRLELRRARGRAGARKRGRHDPGGDL